MFIHNLNKVPAFIKIGLGLKLEIDMMKIIFSAETTKPFFTFLIPVDGTSEVLFTSFHITRNNPPTTSPAIWPAENKFQIIRNMQSAMQLLLKLKHKPQHTPVSASHQSTDHGGRHLGGALHLIPHHPE